MGGDTAKYALDHKLVDALASSADVEKALTKTVWLGKTENNYRAISYYDYSLKTPADTGGTIAVIFANGAIMDGEETRGMSAATLRHRRSATRDHKVKAIVLRVNSLTVASTPRSYPRRTGGGGKSGWQAGGGLNGRYGGLRQLLDLYAGKSYIVASPSTLTGSVASAPSSIR